MRMRLSVTWASSQSRRIWPTRSSSMRELEMSTSSTACSSQMRRRWPLPPKTRRPWMTLPFLKRVVVDEADRRVLELEVVAHLAQEQLARVARAVDEHAAAARRGRGQELPEEAERDPAPGEHQEEEHRVEDEDGAREALEAEGEEQHEHARHRPGRHRLGVDDQVVEADVAPDAAVDARGEERRHLDEDEDGDGREEEPPHLRREVGAEEQSRRRSSTPG